MRKVGLVAAREFITTVSTRGFLIGLLIMPALFALVGTLAPRLLNARVPQVRGDVAIVDPTGKVLGELRAALDPATLAARRAESVRQTTATVAPAIGPAAAADAVQRLLGQVPALRIVERPAGTDIQNEKSWLTIQSQGEAERHLALAVIQGDAIARAGGKSEYGTYDLYVSTSLDDATETTIADGLRQAIISARLAASNLDRVAIEATMRVTRPQSVIVAAGGEQQAQRGFTRALPFILGVLLFMGVMVGGQTLMTSTIEEKSSRVIEVLLAAVSPLELMAGKLLGQMGVGLLVMSVYVSLGILALVQFAIFGLLNPILILYLFVFFLITYLVFGALMMAIDSSVNQVAEAQSLMGPVMMLLLIPYILTPVIGRAPNSTLAVVLSFTPPMNAFVMMARLASDTPPPAWQAWLTVGVGALAACGVLWFAAKIFKIGLLMHGKPPNFATLVRWARAA